uniref:NADH dehydrogenase subunit 2 n=1 Tax=Prosthogonimus cuneatus TaxID=232414 RepID=A0A7L7S2Z2_9TREM|nr:NADH dehydrogenase subunit 2 [Prosthogonimus cuneatus]QNU39793.1 NADH dehydrogenase subunit 2 [Prosthogonimus cuneatus]
MWYLISLNLISVCSFFYCYFNCVNYMSLWFLLELLTVSVIPWFLFGYSFSSQRSLLCYIVTSVFASFFLVGGVLVCDFLWLFVGLGVFIKLGVFPFMGWAYGVVCGSNWISVWFFSGLLKVPFLFILYSFGPDSIFFNISCFVCFLILSYNMWKIRVFDWRRCWCHIMLSGSVSLVVVGVCCGSGVVLLFYCVYFIWASLALMLFFFLSKPGSVYGWFFVFCYIVVFLSFPFSFAFFYKFFLSWCMLGSGFFVFSSWCLYTISEQLFLVYVLLGFSKVRLFSGLLSSV